MSTTFLLLKKEIQNLNYCLLNLRSIPKRVTKGGYPGVKKGDIFFKPDLTDQILDIRSSDSLIDLQNFLRYLFFHLRSFGRRSKETRFDEDKIDEMYNASSKREKKKGREGRR